MSVKRASFGDDIELHEHPGRMQRMPFLSTGKSVGTRFFNYGRHFRHIAGFVLVAAVLVWIIDTWGDAMLEWTHDDRDDALAPLTDKGQQLHVMIPATYDETNLCKTTMGLAVLGYPTPVLLGWGKEYSNDTYAIAGGAQLGSKITEALAYVNTLENDNDLVMMADAYDSWFQLPPDILRSRYFRVIYTASYRMRRRLGRRPIRREALKQTVVFGATKQCSPSQLSSIACYPVPEAPTPRDMYGPQTDTIMGTNKHTSFRPRYLDAGFMMGPVGDVRRLLKRAQGMIDELPGMDILSNMNGKDTKNLWQGDAQGIFQRIFGEQAFQREEIRKRYRSWFKKWSPPRTPGSIEGHAFDDITNPDFTHEIMKPMKGHPREFGINLDFSGRIVSNMHNAERDHRKVLLDGRPQEDFDKSFEDRLAFDCKNRIESTAPADLQASTVPDTIDHRGSWSEVHLFGNLCLGHVPAVLHLNGDKGIREFAWPDVWWQPRLKERLANADQYPQYKGTGAGAYDMARNFLHLDQLCPREADSELYRDG